MGTPHKHAALIKAWADGAEIQVRDLTNYFDPCDCKWKDFSVFDDEVWYSDWEYRIKPKTIKYRIYLMKHWSGELTVGMVKDYTTHCCTETTPSFIKWLGDWQVVEV